MRTEFRRAILPKEIRGLVAFDHKVFRKADWFPRADWKLYKSYWMIVENKKVGCCAFQHNVDFEEDPDKEDPPRRGSLFVSTTGVLPSVQRMGLGKLMKCWQISYARHHGFNRIVTNCRKSNRAIIGLNEKFGFKIIRTTPNYYEDPKEATVVMELKL
jgi:ribosomal protein S18 acetylase RimI-like enzyme